jgi:hypothetical protein
MGDVLDAEAADVLVVDVSENVVGLKVGKVKPQEQHGSVDVVVDAQPHDQVVSQRQAAVGRDLAPLLDRQSYLPVAKDRSPVFGPEYRLVLMPLNLAGSGTSTAPAGSGRMRHLKGLLAWRSLLLSKPQYIAA